MSRVTQTDNLHFRQVGDIFFSSSLQRLTALLVAAAALKCQSAAAEGIVNPLTWQLRQQFFFERVISTSKNTGVLFWGGKAGAFQRSQEKSKVVPGALSQERGFPGSGLPAVTATSRRSQKCGSQSQRSCNNSEFILSSREVTPPTGQLVEFGAVKKHSSFNQCTWCSVLQKYYMVWRNVVMWATSAHDNNHSFVS